MTNLLSKLLLKTGENNISTKDKIGTQNGKLYTCIYSDSQCILSILIVSQN